MEALINNGWSLTSTTGNVMLLIMVAYIAVNVIINKKLTVIQLVGNILLATVCFVLVLLRR